MMALLYQNFDLRDLISLMGMDVKGLFGDFWRNPEIPDYTDYETITPITNTLKNIEKSVKSLFQICVIRAFWASPESSPGGQIDSRKGHGTSE